MKRPRRLSMGRYVVKSGGQEIILQRCGRSGFRVVMRPGSLSPVFRLLRDAARIAQEAVNPWPFSVEKKFDAAADMPSYLRRTKQNELA